MTRETAGLSPERRNELLADLEEHIAVALAAKPATGDDQVRTVLARLGAPRTIAATALGEELPAPRTSQSRTLQDGARECVPGPRSSAGRRPIVRA
ncbi:HAAS signaling domain-containing protein [Streptomyces puniciscabiei]|uniref:HAAS signaling domain-containing protein n=1 Tax=Streptomyces puniciscabiei TaxID=164348 RepID=UPI003CC700AC